MRRLAIAAVALVVATAFAQGRATGEITVETRVAAIGDFGVGGTRQAALGRAMERFEARNSVDVLVTVGDNDYTESPEAFRANWTQSFGWLKSARVGVAGSLGNHDVRVQGGRYQLGLLGMPGPTYRRKVGLVELFVLNSNAVTAQQRRWLDHALRTSRAQWKVAVFHHPPFTCGAYRSHPGIVRTWVPLFERHGVQLVLAGHDHNYQRFVPRRGVTYVVHGGGVGSYYPVTRCPAGYPRRARGRREHGWAYFVFTKERAVGWAVNISGRRTDRFTLVP